MGWADWMVVNQSLEEELELNVTYEMCEAVRIKTRLERYACHWSGPTGIRPSC